MSDLLFSSYINPIADGDEIGGPRSVGTSAAGERPFSQSAWVQQSAGTLFGYLNRRLDVDIARRLQGDMPEVLQRGTQPRVGLGGRGVPQPAQPMQQGVDTSTLLLLLAAGVAVFFIATS
jgi:hypothetical protein